MIKSTFIPAFLFAEPHSRLWGTFAIVLMPNITGFAFTCCLSRNALNSQDYLVISQFNYETIKLTLI